MWIAFWFWGDDVAAVQIMNCCGGVLYYFLNE